MLLPHITDSNDTATKYDVTSYTYDANGNTLTTTVDDVKKTRTYTTRNEVKTFTDGGNSANNASYTYGPDGLRTTKTVNGTKTTYIWSGGNIVAEITSDKTVVYLYGLNRISRTITGTKYVEPYTEIYVYDTHGNVVQLANKSIIDDITTLYWLSNDHPEEFDFNGDGYINSTDLQSFINIYPVTLSYHYDAFGNLLDEDAVYDTNPFRYCGEYWDKETGEIYLRARYYNPRTGRFTTVDPAMDGTNWYVYCSGNPIGFVDPWGLYDKDLLEELLGYTFGYDSRHRYYRDKANDVRDKLKYNTQYFEKWNPGSELDELFDKLTSDEAYKNGSSIADINRAIELTDKYWNDYFNKQIKEDIIEIGVLTAIIAPVAKAAIAAPIIVEASEPPKTPDIKYPGNDPSKAPGSDWEWRGNGDAGSKGGNWYNPNTGESLHPDLDHGEPIGPHWDYDYRGSGTDGWRIFPDGTVLPK